MMRKLWSESHNTQRSLQVPGRQPEWGQWNCYIPHESIIRLKCQLMVHYDHLKKTGIHHAGWSLMTQCKFHISWNPVMWFVIEMWWHNTMVIQQPAKHFKIFNQPHKKDAAKYIHTHTHTATESTSY